jgi:hypothetical protein
VAQKAAGPSFLVPLVDPLPHLFTMLPKGRARRYTAPILAPLYSCQGKVVSPRRI